MNVSITEIYEGEQPVSWIADTEKVNPILRKAIETALADKEWKQAEMNCNAGFQVETYNPEAVVEPPCMVEAEITLYATGEYSDDLEELEFEYREKYGDGDDD